MPHGNDCPACARDIGIWALFKAPLPNRIRCPHCRERLWYRDAGGLIAVFAVLLAVLVAAALGAAYASGIEGSPIAAAVAVLLIGFVPFEVSYVLLLRYGGYHLVAASAPKRRMDDEAF